MDIVFERQGAGAPLVLLHGIGHRRQAQQRLPHARFVWLPGCGHVPMWDDPELVGQLLLDGSAHPLPTPQAAA